MTLFGALVGTKAKVIWYLGHDRTDEHSRPPVFQAEGRFLDFNVSQSLIVKLQSRLFGVSVIFLNNK